MASQGGTSRLAQMQMRFQQKQQQEREQRKIEMTGGNKLNADGIEVKSLTSTIGPGKVRQMFDERRQRSTGIDKSYPLKPIPNRTLSGSATTTVTTTTTSSSSSSSTTTVQKQTSTMKQTIKKAESEICTSKKNSILNGDATILLNEINSDHVDNANDYENNNEMINVPIPNKLPNVGKLSLGHLDNNRKLNGNASGDKNNNNNNNNSSRTASNANIKLKPVVTRKTLPTEQKSPKKSQSSNLNSTSRHSVTTRSPEKSLFTLPKQKTNTKTAASTMSKNSQVIQKETDAVAPIPDNMAACQFCGRHFNVDRIEKHQEICQRMANKKRKIFDASKHRVQGTEAEKYLKKGIRSGKSTTIKLTQDSAASLKNSWRKKHEEFIQAIRSAKEMQAHLARGGKLSDLPPPPPSENPDYIQCPHCKRRFNEGAATRHIPKCADMLHNKPKPGAPAKRGAKR